MAEYLYDMGGELVTTVDGAGQIVRTVQRAEGVHYGDYVGATGPGGERAEYRLAEPGGDAGGERARAA